MTVQNRRQFEGTSSALIAVAPRPCFVVSFLEFSGRNDEETHDPHSVYIVGRFESGPLIVCINSTVIVHDVTFNVTSDVINYVTNCLRKTSAD